MNIVKVAKNYMEFDIIGVAPSIANAIRRTTIAEVSLTQVSDFDNVVSIGTHDGHRNRICHE